MILLPYTRQNQSGFALVAALFLIVVLAGLGLFAIKLSSSQQQSTNLTLLGSRAHAAASSGIEYGASRALHSNICPTLPATVTLNLNQGALKGFTVIVSCIHTSPEVANITYQFFELQAIATYGTYGQPDYVSRSISRTVSK